MTRLRSATLRQLQIFVSAARTLSFARTAVALHLTQPAVSMQLRQLEEAAGLPLFERSGRRTRLTAAGEELAVHARQVFETLRQAEERLDALKGLRGGRLAIAAVSTAKYFAPRLLALFRHEHPQVDIALAVNNREIVVQQLAGNETDLAIMGQPPPGLETDAAAFARHPLGVVAAPDHPLARERAIPVARIARESLISREPGSGTRSSMERFFQARGLEPRIGMVMPSNETIKQAVMAGMGVAFLSLHTVGLEVETGRLTVLDVADTPLMRTWYVVALSSKRLSPAALAFRAFVLERALPYLERAFPADGTGRAPAAQRGGSGARRRARSSSAHTRSAASRMRGV